MDEVEWKYPVNTYCKILSIETKPTSATPRIHELHARVQLSGGEVISFRALVGIHLVENPGALERWVNHFILGSNEYTAEGD